MTDEIHPLARNINGQPVYRRHHLKTDGRDLYLYGYTPHQDARLPGEDLARAAGSELRRHPLRGDWSIYAAHRQNRTFKPRQAEDPLAPSRPGAPLTEIPFPDFELAIFENRFPSLHLDAPPPAASPLTMASSKGRCDVVVYTPNATGSLATLTQAQRRLLVEAWIDRYETLFAAGCAFVLPFENRGDEVGVTLHHPHGQIYGFPIIPAPQAHAAAAFADGYDLAVEAQAWQRDFGICAAGGLIAYAPPFARFPYEVWISGLTQHPGPWTFSNTEADGFAYLLGEVTKRYDAYFERQTPYMLTLHAAPRGTEDTFHFSAQFYPLLRDKTRVKYLASVEQATGVFTVDILPEQTADRLKGAI